MTSHPNPRPSPRPALRSTVLLLSSLALAASLHANSSWRVRQVSSVSARSFVTGYVGEPVVGDLLRPADRAFLTRAAKAGREAARLAEIGATRTERAEVRSLARQMMTDFRTMGESIDALSRRKGGAATVIEAARPEPYPGLSDKAGASFEREFVQTAAQLSDALLTAYEQAASEARDADVRDFAAAQLPTLRAHRTSLAELRRMID